MVENVNMKVVNHSFTNSCESKTLSIMRGGLLASRSLRSVAGGHLCTVQGLFGSKNTANKIPNHALSELTAAATNATKDLRSGNGRIEEHATWMEAPADPPAANVPLAPRGRPPGATNQPYVQLADANIANINIRPYKCPHCEKGFADKWHLRRHIRIHTGDRPFACPFCPMAFNQKNTLIGHMRRHTGDKPYRCQLCCVAFSWKSTFVKHMQQHGPEHIPLSFN